MKSGKRKVLTAIIIINISLIALSGLKLNQLNEATKIKEDMNNNLKLELEKLSESKTEEEIEEIDYLGLVNEEYETDNITSIISIGNIITEPTVIDPIEFYSRRLPNGDGHVSGTIMMVGPQESPDESYTAYYGHSMKDGTAFGKMISSKYSIDDYMHSKVLTASGEKTLELIHSSRISDIPFDKADINSYEGLLEYISLVEEVGKVIYNNIDDLTEDDWLTTMSTCATSGGETRAVMIYKEVKNND